MGKIKELALPDWCASRGCGITSGMARAEEARRKKRDQMLARIDALKRGEPDAQTLAAVQSAAHFEAAVDHVRRGMLPVGEHDTPTRAAPAAGMTRRIIEGPTRTRYAGLDCVETTFDCGGLRYLLREFDSGERHTMRLSDGSSSRTAGGYSRRDHTATASYQGEE